jgi:DinB superfamily
MPLTISALSRLQHQHRTIRELTGALPDEQVRLRPDPEKWSVFENVAHLACYQGLFLLRLERIMTEDSPAFPRYVAETDPDFPDYLKRTTASLLGDIDTRRQTLLTKLEGMTETGFGRTALHPKFGLLDVVQWTEFFLLHEAHHLYTIFRLVCEQKKDRR